MKDLIDTHCHLTDARFAGDVDAVLDRARAARIRWMVTIGSDLSDSRAAVSLAAAHEGVYAAVGIHPHAADTATEEAFQGIHELAANDAVVAIGETGVDLYYDNAPRQAQIASFERHLALAEALDLPVVVHAREADEAVRAIIRDAGWRRGVLHCFSSGRRLLEEALDLGWFVSFAGMVTFKRWADAELLRAVPLDRLLVETDSPYLAPVPHRGKRNEPAFVRLVAERVAELRGEDPDHVAEVTTANALRFYRIEPNGAATAPDAH